MKKRAHLSLLAICLISLQAAAQSDPARDAKRAADWHVPEIFRALQVDRGGRIADIGCGDGFLTLRLASAVGESGRIFAVDIDAGALERLRRRVDREGARNVEIVRGEAADPHLAPAAIDGVVILRAYHEFSQHREMLAAIRAALRPGGRVVIADVAPRDPSLGRESQVSLHVMAPRLVEQDLAEAGFHIAVSVPEFARLEHGETAWLIAAERPGAGGRRSSSLAPAPRLRYTLSLVPEEWNGTDRSRPPSPSRGQGR
jgi:SAM-dependent methyltransferase